LLLLLAIPILLDIHHFQIQKIDKAKSKMNSPPISGSGGGGSRRARYSRSPSSGGVPPSKRSKPSSLGDTGNSSDHHRLYTSICVKNINPKIPDLGKES
jgi:hypothetical protein